MPTAYHPDDLPKDSCVLPRDYFAARKDSSILSDDIIARLRAFNPSLVGDAENGKRSIALELITPSHSSRPEFLANATSSPMRYTTIPTHIESIEMFEFMGFTPEKAERLWESRMISIWCAEMSCPGFFHDSYVFDEFPRDVRSWALDEVREQWGKIACADSTDDWDNVIAKMGLNDEIRAVFRKPEHNNIRLMQTLSAWLVEILSTSFEALSFLELRILESLDSPPADIHEKGGETIPQVPDDHITLYKSVECQIRAQTLRKPSLEHGRMWGDGPSDFSQGYDVYFTQQSWVAEQYSALISNACVVALRRTVEVHVPLAHLQAVGLWELKFEDELFKQLAFVCRNYRGLNQGNHSEEMRDMLSEYGVISGPMLQAHNLTFKKMASWRDITEEHQLRNNDDPNDVAKQYCWIGSDDWDLMDVVEEKLYYRPAA